LDVMRLNRKRGTNRDVAVLNRTDQRGIHSIGFTQKVTEDFDDRRDQKKGGNEKEDPTGRCATAYGAVGKKKKKKKTRNPS